MKKKKNVLLAIIIIMLSIIFFPITQTTAATNSMQFATAGISKVVAEYLFVPRLSETKVTLNVGETKEIKLISPYYELKKVTTTNKEHVGVFGKKPVKKTVMIKGKDAGYTETVKMYVEVKKSVWKKYKKFLKGRKVTLKCKVKVITKEGSEEEVEAEQEPEVQQTEPEEQVLEKYDSSQWKPDKTLFVYNGKKQRPTLVGVPADVKLNYSSDGEIVVGEYMLTISFEVPKTHEPIKPMQVKYSIVSRSIEYGYTGGYVSTGDNSNVNKPAEKPSRPEEQPSQPEHICTWTEWEAKDRTFEIRRCSVCRKEEIRKHLFQIKTSFEKLDDMQHSVKKKYVCDMCEKEYEDTLTEAHKKTKWHYVGEDLDSEGCENCDYVKTREHQHEEASADVQYTFKVSNNDGTHELEGSYICNLCGETVSVSKNEECDFEETRKMTDEMHNMRNIHIVLKDCKVCAYHREDEESCLSDGVTFYFRYLSQIYTAETFTISKYRCNQKPHFDHEFGKWTYYDKDTHRRECPCTDAREEEAHQYGEYDPTLGGFYCPVCDYTEIVEAHDHGHGFAGKWGDKNLMFDVVMNKEAYAELVNMSPIRNPEPSLETYCSRLDFQCNTCGVPYSAYMRHEFKDGVCVCGVIEASATMLVITEPTEIIQAEVISGGAIAAN